MIQVAKQNPATSWWKPFETGTIAVADKGPWTLMVSDAAGRLYFEKNITGPKKVRFTARGAAGLHSVMIADREGRLRDREVFTLQPKTEISCDKGPYAKLALRLENLIREITEPRSHTVSGKFYNLLVCWGRDHVHVLKAHKYHIYDVKSGIEFFLERQRPNGMFWDDIHHNSNAPYPTSFGEALGKGYFAYEENNKWILRRIPVEADVEFLYTEGVWYAWKASGDDAWMKTQLPKLDKALKYNNSHPVRWSKKHGLVKRSYCMDSWDFANPHFCNGDHRCINPGDPQFLFHSDNSGLYSIYWRLAEMHEAAGNAKRAAELRKEGEAFRKRANKKLFHDPVYAHMLPEYPIPNLKKLVGDDTQRMSLSTGYTINRGLPTHEMAVKVIKEYQRRGRARKKESFAEWWSMDPMYEPRQWPDRHCTKGDYMNGAICPIVAGEIAKAAFDHGLENYGADILQRVWKLSERDGGSLHQAYRRIPENPPPPKANFKTADLEPFVNAGLKYRARKGVKAWTDEGANDMRNLPTGRRTFGAIQFKVIDPAKNKKRPGCAVLRLDAEEKAGPREVLVPVKKLKGQSLYFLHSQVFSGAGVMGTYDVIYGDGTEERIFVRSGHEIGHWWGITLNAIKTNRNNFPESTRIGWQGPNGTWKNVGLFMFGWNNPHPMKAITGIRLAAARHSRGIMVAAISVSDKPVKFEERIRSYGLPASWSQAAVYYAITEGLAGIADEGRAFSSARIAPRWAATESNKAEVTLHYPASDGYVSYRYKNEPQKRRLTLDITGSFENARLHCLLPKGKKARRVTAGKREISFENTRIEQSNYADFSLDEMPPGPIRIEY